MDSGAMISSIKTGSGIQKLIEGDSQTDNMEMLCLPVINNYS
jgi:hypothetical protein